MADLFSPFTLKGVTLRNRIAVSPMCQYSAVNGLLNEWHQVHYAGLARGGAGVVVVEATGVAPEGRITPGCTGIWTDEHAAKFEPIVQSIEAAGAVPGLQLAHAGRKASANRPWEGDDHIPEDHPESWQPVAPSAVAFGRHLHRVPREMTKDDIIRVQNDFVEGAKRALRVGFRWLNLHFAHGYLGQNFLSIHSNKRTDEYGGSFENRARFLLETLAAVRAVWPEEYPLSVRLGVVEFDGRDEETLAEAIELVRRFKVAGLDMVDVSFGFSTYENQIPWGPALLVPFAERVRREADIPTSTTWNIGTSKLADDVIRQESIDVVMLGRSFLQNPHWPDTAARELGRDAANWTLPAPYGYWLERYGVAKLT
jgi:NADPH2 dehydrogenase